MRIFCNLKYASRPILSPLSCIASHSRSFHASSVALGKGGREQKTRPAPKMTVSAKAVPSTKTTPVQTVGEDDGYDSVDGDGGSGGDKKLGKDFESQLTRHVAYAKREMGKLRGSVVSADILDGVMVQAYGETQALKDLAQVALRGPLQLVVSPFDGALSGAIAEAIRASDLGLNPQEEGNMLRVPIPKPSKETREAAAKQVSRIAEQAKVRVRRSRSGALEKAKKNSDGISEDDIKLECEKVESMAASSTAEIAKLADSKRKEIEAGL